jgi:hypothetical protein
MTSPQEPPRFECAAGTVVGWRDSDLVRATGIRYARAERFQAPSAQPLAAEPILATAWAPACPQVPEPITEVAWGADHLGQRATTNTANACRSRCPRTQSPARTYHWNHRQTDHDVPGMMGPGNDGLASAVLRRQVLGFALGRFRRPWLW